MRTSSAKAKGKRLAKLVKQKILSRFVDLGDEDIEIPRGSLPGADLKFSSKARTILPFAFELKNQEKLNLWAAIEQAKRHVKDGDSDVPVVVFSRNHSEPQICLSLDDFLKLIQS